MATLYKHGEIGQVERLAYRLAYCEDGNILRNDGDGFKMWKRLRKEINPQAAFERAKEKYAEKLATFPCFAAWRSEFHALIPFKLRNLALSVISMMPQDPDGVWSELNDFCSMQGDGDLLSVEDACNLCRLYEAARLEGKEHEATKQAQAQPVTA